MPRDTWTGNERAKPFPWNVVAGLALIAVAGSYLFDSDYPLAWVEPRSSSPFRVSRLAPRAAPVGEDLVFRWQWDGADPGEWVVVVEDASFEPLFRSEPIDGYTYRAPERLRALLRSGGRFHWRVEAASGAGPESGPIGFDLR